MIRRNPRFATTALCMLALLSLSFALPSASSAQPTSGFTYVIHMMEEAEAVAGMPLDIPIFLQNNGASTVTLTVDLSQNAVGAFTLDSLGRVKVLDHGQMDVVFVRFQSVSVGRHEALLTVTDGAVTDSLRLIVNVVPGPGPFVLLPPFQGVTADLGKATQIPVSIQNLTGNPLTVQLSLNGSAEFSLAGNGSLTIPAFGSVTALVDFLSLVEGQFETILQVTDGSHTDSAAIGVIAFEQPYKWLVLFHDEIETLVGMEAAFPVMLINRGNSPVTLSLALNGSNVFTLDPADQQVTLQPGMGEDVMLSVLGTTPGTFTSLLTVTDGVDTDSLEVRVIVHEGPGNFLLHPDFHEMRLAENESATTIFRVENLTYITHPLTVTLAGDAAFTYTGSSPLTLGPGASVEVPVSFSGTAKGVYTAQVSVSDGIESDSAMIVAYVGDGHSGGPLFTVEYDGKNGFMLFETAENTTLTKDITLRNISGQQLTLDFDLMTGGAFSIGASTMTLDSGAVQTLAVTFDNSYAGFGEGMLLIDGGQQVEHLMLFGATPPYKDYDGVLISRMLDFGMVDSSTTLCLDAVIENKTQHTITVNSATLSGFSSAFTLPHLTLPASIQPNASMAIRVCFHPMSTAQVENEVLTVAFINPAATPTAQNVNIDLTGRSATGIHFPGDSTGIVGWYVNTVSAPIDGQSDVTIELFNITPQPVTFAAAAWEDGNDEGIYSLQTALPVTIQPHAPGMPASGKTDITIRYAPTTQSSAVGVEDVATLRMHTDPTSIPMTVFLTLVGIPTTPAPNSGSIALFPKDRRIPAIEMGDVETAGTRILEFVNNLQVPVTVAGFSMDASSHFEIINAQEFPREAQPGETIALMLRSKEVPTRRITDVLTMHGSHDHLNSRFDLVSGPTVTGIGDQPVSPTTVTAALSPNPATDRLRVTLSEPLASGSIEVMDMLGRVVARRDGAIADWTWNGRIDGVPAHAGAYRIRVSGVTAQGVRVSLTKNALIVR